MTVVAEATNMATARAVAPGAAALAPSATVVTSVSPATSRRRFALSPSGAKNSRPTA
ncbi:hypothetical protein SPURM210S_00849 [Streptomyces purpurascens]